MFLSKKFTYFSVSIHFSHEVYRISMTHMMNFIFKSVLFNRWSIYLFDAARVNFNEIHLLAFSKLVEKFSKDYLIRQQKTGSSYQNKNRNKCGSDEIIRKNEDNSNNKNKIESDSENENESDGDNEYEDNEFECEEAEEKESKYITDNTNLQTTHIIWHLTWNTKYLLILFILLYFTLSFYKSYILYRQFST